MAKFSTRDKKGQRRDGYYKFSCYPVPMPRHARIDIPGLLQHVIVRAKAVICHMAVRQLQIRGVEVAERLGYTSAAVTHATKRGEIILAAEDTLGELLNNDGKLKIA